MANVRIGDAIFRNRKEAEQRVPEAVFTVRIFGICTVLFGILMLATSIQKLLILLEIVKQP